MFDPSRRSLLKAAALLPLAMQLARLDGAIARSSTSVPVEDEFVLQAGGRGRLISDMLTGLSYETLQLVDPRFFPRDAVTSRYSAIAGDVGFGFQPHPLYYGMLLAQQFAGARCVPGQFASGGAHLTAYAARKSEKLLLALFNKSADRDATAGLGGVAVDMSAQVQRLHAASLTERHDVYFDDGNHAAGGTHPKSGETLVADASGRYRISLPRASAVLAKF